MIFKIDHSYYMSLTTIQVLRDDMNYYYYLGAGKGGRGVGEQFSGISENNSKYDQEMSELFHRVPFLFM